MADSRAINVLRSELFPGEDKYFRENPRVSGMASESGHVILNPYSGKDINKDAVYQNELSRLYMRGQLPGFPQVRPGFDLTPEQENILGNTTYRNSPIQDQRETIAARHFSGDPTGGGMTGDQLAFRNAMVRALMNGK
jgi:hypothetical protein